MKNQIIFLTILQIGFSVFSFAQTEFLFLPDNQETDSIVKTEFNDYLKFILTYSNDSILEIDSSKIYNICFITTHSFYYESEIYDSCYIDSEKIICTENIRKLSDSIQLNFIDYNIVDSGLTKLNDSLKLNLTFHTYKKLPTYEFFMGNYSSLISFKNGEYIIISEIRFGPDIRGSMPPGYSITYFIELIK